MAPALPNTPKFPEPRCGQDCCPRALLSPQLTPSGAPANASAFAPYLSGNAAWILFTSAATNLTATSPGGLSNVYVHSLDTAETNLASASMFGEAPTGSSQGNAISDSGQYILFTSSADNLAPYDDNGQSDVFVHDQLSGRTVLVSRGLDGWSANGRSIGRDLSADGRFAVYSSAASDITADDTNGAWDVFLADLVTGTTRRISMGPGDQQSNPIAGNHAHVTPDGRYVSFHSQSDSLVAGDSDGVFDIFLFDVVTGTTSRISNSSSLGQPNGNAFVLGMSDDARYFSGYSQATNLVQGDQNGFQDVFLYDRQTGEIVRVDLGPRGQEADAQGMNATLSANGRFVGFSSRATNLVAHDREGTEDSFVFDSWSKTLSRISQTDSGVPGDADSDVARFSRDGDCYVFSSQATNLPTSSAGSEGVSRILVRRK